MGEVIKVESFIPCSICHKRPAKFLCDFPIGREKKLHWKLPNGLTDFENSFKETVITCDRPVCEKCVIEISKNVHFCKECYKGVQNGKGEIT